VRYALSGKDRSLNEVSPLEVLSAMEQVLRESLSSEQDELAAETGNSLATSGWATPTRSCCKPS